MTLEDALQKILDWGEDGAPASELVAIAKDALDELERSRKKRAKKKLGGGYTPEFEAWYKNYPRSQAKTDTFKHFERLRKAKGLDYINTCTRNYISYLNSLPPEKREFCYSSNNFLGQKAYYLDFEVARKPYQNSKPDRPVSTVPI